MEFQNARHPPHLAGSSRVPEVTEESIDLLSGKTLLWHQYSNQPVMGAFELAHDPMRASDNALSSGRQYQEIMWHEDSASSKVHLKESELQQNPVQKTTCFPGEALEHNDLPLNGQKDFPMQAFVMGIHSAVHHQNSRRINDVVLQNPSDHLCLIGSS